MDTGFNSVKIEYQEEIDKKINKLTHLQKSLQKEVDKLTKDVLSGSAKAHIFKSELQAIIDDIDSMISKCHQARSKLIDKGGV